MGNHCSMKQKPRKESFILITISKVPYFSSFVFLQRLLTAGQPKTATQKKKCLRIKLNAIEKIIMEDLLQSVEDLGRNWVPLYNCHLTVACRSLSLQADRPCSISL